MKRLVRMSMSINPFVQIALTLLNEEGILHASDIWHRLN